MFCHVSTPSGTPMVCGQPDFATVFDAINPTGYTGLILQALDLPRIGRVWEMLSHNPSSLGDTVEARTTAGVYQS